MDPSEPPPFTVSIYAEKMHSNILGKPNCPVWSIAQSSIFMHTRSLPLFRSFVQQLVQKQKLET